MFISYTHTHNDKQLIKTTREFFAKSSLLWGHYSDIHTSVWERGDIVYRCTTLRSHLCVKGRCVCAVNKRGETETGAEPCQEIFSDCQGAGMLDFMKKIWPETMLCMKAHKKIHVYVLFFTCIWQKLSAVFVTNYKRSGGCKQILSQLYKCWMSLFFSP